MPNPRSPVTVRLGVVALDGDAAQHSHLQSRNHPVVGHGVLPLASGVWRLAQRVAVEGKVLGSPRRLLTFMLVCNRS